MNSPNFANADRCTPPMRTLLILLFFCIFSNLLFGQKYQFAPNGTMQQSQTYIDTIIKTNIRAENRIIFQKLTFGLDSFNLKERIPKKYAIYSKDSFQYFLIANL